LGTDFAHVGQLWMRSRKFTNWVGWHFITVDSGPEKKLTKLISEVLKRAPVLHLFGNIHLLPVDFLGTQLPSSALASTFIKEAQKEASTVKTAYLASLDEDLTRSAPILQNGLVNWLVSFDSTVSPMVAFLLFMPLQMDCVFICSLYGSVISLPLAFWIGFCAVPQLARSTVDNAGTATGNSCNAGTKTEAARSGCVLRKQTLPHCANHYSMAFVSGGTFK
jgi:hypothetical protein